MRNELNSMIVQKFKSDYKKASRNQKTLILNQLQLLTALDRKHLIKLLASKKILLYQSKYWTLSRFL